MHVSSDVPEHAPTGGKAKGLEKLDTVTGELGFNVPDWEEITPQKLDEIIDHTSFYSMSTAKILDPENTGGSDPITPFFERWKGKTLMVRSNSSLEDGSHSFAGVYQSEKITCTDIEVLRGTLRSVSNSVSSFDASKYRMKHKLGHDSMGVVLQEFIDGIDGGYGVIHSSLPQGDSSFAIAGGNHEDVTDGVGDSWKAEIYKGDYGTIPKNVPKGMEQYISELKKSVIELEKRFGKNDIEYVIGKDGQIYCVQLRSLNIPPTTPMIQGAEVITPLHRWCSAYFVGLPVLVVESLENLIMQGLKNPMNISELEGHHDIALFTVENGRKVHRQEFANVLHQFDANLKNEPLWNWWDEVAAFNKSHPEGYVLSIPNGLPRGFGGLLAFSEEQKKQ